VGNSAAAIEVGCNREQRGEKASDSGVHLNSKRAEVFPLCWKKQLVYDIVDSFLPKTHQHRRSSNAIERYCSALPHKHEFHSAQLVNVGPRDMPDLIEQGSQDPYWQVYAADICCDNEWRLCFCIIIS
jgi:hypothetical protein